LEVYTAGLELAANKHEFKPKRSAVRTVGAATGGRVQHRTTSALGPAIGGPVGGAAVRLEPRRTTCRLQSAHWKDANAPKTNFHGSCELAGSVGSGERVTLAEKLPCPAAWAARRRTTPRRGRAPDWAGVFSGKAPRHVHEEHGPESGAPRVSLATASELNLAASGRASKTRRR
jgi:hypothetical protein